MATGQQTDAREGPPYSSKYQLLGETPSLIPDVPVNAVFLLLFLLGAIGHAWQYRINIVRGRKFIPNAAAFAFCVTRVFTTILWIVWACNPKSIECEIASLIFGYVGIIVLFIVNLIFSRRIVRGQHPNFGWTMRFSIPFTILFIIVVATIICLIVAIVLMFDTRNPSTLASTLEIQRYGATLYAIMSFLPILIVGTSTLARKIPKIKRTSTVDKFGEGSMRTKVAIVIITAVLLSMGAIYRAGAVLAKPILTTEPIPAYLSKACFYVFTFTIEFTIVLFWLLVRIDRRFYVPDGVWGPHSYAGGFVFAGEPGNSKQPVGTRSATTTGESTVSMSGDSQSWSASTLAPKLYDAVSKLSHKSHGSVGTTEAAPSQRGARSVARMSTISLASRSSRNSQSDVRRQRARAREKTISWGGVTREDVIDTLGESRGEIIPYAGFRTESIAADSDPSPDITPDEEVSMPAEVGVEGAERQMGWDAKTGKWALRPLGRVPETPSPTSSTFPDTR